MMNWQLYIRNALLLMCLATFSHGLAAQQATTTDPKAFRKQVDQLEYTVKRVMDINAELGGDSVWDREALVYRRDELTIKVLVMMDQVARALPGLGPESELRKTWEAQLRTGLMGVDDMLFDRLAELNERIAANEQRMKAKQELVLWVVKKLVDVTGHRHPRLHLDRLRRK